MIAKTRWASANTVTLDLRIAARETRAEIDRLVALTGKGAMDGFDSDSSAGGLTTRGPPTPRPPWIPPPRRPPLPPCLPPQATHPTFDGKAPMVARETDPLGEAPKIKHEGPRPFPQPDNPHERATCTPGHVMRPTEIPSFNSRVPPTRGPTHRPY